MTGTGTLANDWMRVAAGAARTLALVGAALVGSTTGRVVSSPIDMNAVCSRNLTGKSCGFRLEGSIFLAAAVVPRFQGTG